MRWTPQEYAAYQARRYRPTAQLERRVSHEPMGAAPAQKGHPGIRSVSVISRRIRLLDADNLCCKFHIDSLRYLGILAGDSPKHITLSVSQEKVASKADECTLITIT